jgi:hypothetical protein
VNHALKDFCDSLRVQPSSALEALLKIAETKEAMLRWEREATSVSSQDDLDEGPESTSTALELALAYVDRAEETILDAFCLSQETRRASSVQMINSP